MFSEKQQKNRLKLSGIILALLVFPACTKSGVAVGDCVVDPDARDGTDMVQVTSIEEGRIFGNRFFNGEPTGELVDIDATGDYKKVDCPE